VALADLEHAVLDLVGRCVRGELRELGVEVAQSARF
jgi:hypothetical protein